MCSSRRTEMSDPHFNDERIVEREVERPATERVVERPSRGRTVSERRTGGMGGMSTNPVALILAGVLAVFIIVLVFGYLL
jgi:hypothetical protein